ncbi:MAG: SCP2 domain-containing protein [Woeseiaceae bacterium]
MDALEALFRPLTTLINHQIKATTPARELCAELDGSVIAVRVKDTALAIYFCVHPDEIALFGDFDGEPDVVITGSILSLARLAGESGEQAIRDGSIDLTGDAEVARDFQRLLRFGRPDIEEELSGIIGDVAAHRLGEVARGVGKWGREATSTLRQNISEYLAEERRDVPSRHEVEAFSRKVDALRDDVARLEARLNRLDQAD